MDYEDDYRRDARSGADSDPDGFDFAQLKKNKMTKIYSGRRNIFLQKVPTLFESCIHVLCDNIDGKWDVFVCDLESMYGQGMVGQARPG